MNVTLEFFDFQSLIYDTYQTRCVPKYRDMISTAVDWLRFLDPGREQVRILDLGCGTGNTCLAVLDAFPRARVDCLDGSTEMIAAARRKVSSGNVEFHRGDLAQDDWGERWADETFDAAISVLVLEHLPFDQYRKCLSTLLRILKPGAWAAVVEGHAGELTQRIYFAEMSAAEEEAVRTGTIDREELQRMKKLSAEKETHYFASLDEKRQWWTEAGFSDVNTIWQYYCVGTIVGRKTCP